MHTLRHQHMLKGYGAWHELTFTEGASLVFSVFLSKPLAFSQFKTQEKWNHLLELTYGFIFGHFYQLGPMFRQQMTPFPEPAGMTKCQLRPEAARSAELWEQGEQVTRGRWGACCRVGLVLMKEELFICLCNFPIKHRTLFTVHKHTKDKPNI